MIVRLAQDKYVDWSGVTDSPVTSVMGREEMEAFVRDIEARQIGKDKLHDQGEVGTLARELLEKSVAKRLDRLDKNGTTSMTGTTLESLLGFNRAGPNETHLKTVEEIIEVYTYDPKKRGFWPWT